MKAFKKLTAEEQIEQIKLFISSLPEAEQEAARKALL